MKQVLINYMGKTDIPYIIIRSKEDLDEFKEFMEKESDNFLHKVMCLDIPIKNMDHYMVRGAMGAIWRSCVFIDQKIHGLNPILRIPTRTSEFLILLYNTFNRLGTLVISNNGGFCHLLDSMEITQESEYVPQDTRDRKISQNTKFLNLENDPVLETHTKKFLPKLDPNYSYITCLRDFTDSELTDLMTQFVSKGGQALYVYTTGIDTEQMDTYLSIAVSTGIKHFVFEFSATRTTEIDNVLEKYKSDNLVEIIG